MLNRFSAAAIATGLAVLLFVFSSQRAFGSDQGSSSAQHQPEVSNFIEEKLRTWQQRMNLKDWDIHAELVRADRLEPRTLGNIHWDADVKKATINVLSPLDYPLAHDAMLADMEVTIVHELVHLELASLPRSDASRRVEERAVDQLAAALLRLASR